MAPMIFSCYHTSPLGGHLGVYKTLNKIWENFIWKLMDNDIHKCVRHCNVHAIRKPAKNTQVCWSLKSQITHFRKILKTTLENFRIVRCNNMLLSVCGLSQCRQPQLLPQLRHSEIWVFTSFSVPETIVSDNAKCFVSQEFKQFSFDLAWNMWVLHLIIPSLPMQNISTETCLWLLLPTMKSKAVPLHAMEALVGRGGIAPTHSRPRH
jgi:hypothetical protein